MARRGCWRKRGRARLWYPPAIILPPPVSAASSPTALSLLETPASGMGSVRSAGDSAMDEIACMATWSMQEGPGGKLAPGQGLYRVRGLHLRRGDFRGPCRRLWTASPSLPWPRSPMSSPRRRTLKCPRSTWWRSRRRAENPVPTPAAHGNTPRCSFARCIRGYFACYGRSRLSAAGILGFRVPR